MSTKNKTQKVYGLFYNDHGIWRVATTNRQTLAQAQVIKKNVARRLKSRVIIRKVN